jgi:hypothetical protein
MPFLPEAISKIACSQCRMGKWLASKMVPIHGQGLAALVALVGADPGAFTAHLGNPLRAPAMRADSPIGPEPRLDEGVGGGLVMEMPVGKD